MPKNSKAKPTKPKKWEVKSSQNEKGHRANVGTGIQPLYLHIRRSEIRSQENIKTAMGMLSVCLKSSLNTYLTTL